MSAPPEQIEINLGSFDPLSGAVDATTREFSAKPDAATLADARARAQNLLRGTNDEDAAGLRDLQNLTLSMGLPATRIIFRHMIAASGKRGAVKRDATREVRELSPLTEVGCMRVDFLNRMTQKPDIAYLLLDQCPKTHNLGAQLDKLKSLVADEKWPDVLKHFSMLVHIGRSVYGNVTRQRLPLIRRLFDLSPDDKCEKYLDLQIDRSNTTLFIDVDWPNRVGIFVRLGAEVVSSSEADAK